MLTLVLPEIEQYATDHTSPLPQHPDTLMQVTHDTMDFPQMISGPIEGTLLQFLVWISGARRVLEIGTFAGFSAQMMAAGLPEDGTVITCEINPEAEKLAKDYFKRGPNGHKIDMRMGPAQETLKGLAPPFDLVFVDADKQSYAPYYERSLELLSPKGILVVDNVLWSGRVLDPQDETDHALAQFNEHVRQDTRVQHVLLPIRDGIMLIRRKGGF